MQNKLGLDKPYALLFWSFGLICLASIFSALATGFYLLALIPAVFLLGFLCIQDVKIIYYLLFFTIPMSTAIDVGGGFSTDFPSEFITVLLMGVTVLLLLINGKKIDKAFFLHPISIALFIHFAWIFISVFFSENVFVSIKYFLAKAWYIFTFFILSGLLLQKKEHIKKLVWCFSISMIITVIIILMRHAAIGFSFKEVNYVLRPFYRNHVAYASILTVCFPFVFFAKNWYPKFSKKWYLLIAFSILLVIGIYFSYTRAAFVSLLILLPSYFIVRLKLTKIAFIAAFGLILLLFFSLSYKNTFLDYTPDYERTVAHKRYDNLLEATLKGEDISTMERFYRWIASVYMVKEKPWTGYGPGNFYNFYKSHTLESFKTYVSDNPEKSGVHNYFLMVLVEQGVIGFLIFLYLSFIIFSKGEQVYHKLKNKTDKALVMTCMLSLIVVYSLLLMNDMIETDKVGSFFFLSLALLVKLDLKQLVFHRESSE